MAKVMQAGASAEKGVSATLAESMDRMREQGFTHGVWLDADGIEQPGPAPLRVWLGVVESDPVQFRIEGADLLHLGDDKPRVIARAVSIPTRWHWLRQPWPAMTAPAPDCPWGFLADLGYSVRDYCAICGACLAGAPEDGHSAIFDNGARVVHVVDAPCAARFRAGVTWPTGEELGAAPPPVIARRPSVWDRIRKHEV